jgi:hypothetical protein
MTFPQAHYAFEVPALAELAGARTVTPGRMLALLREVRSGARIATLAAAWDAGTIDRTTLATAMKSVWHHGDGAVPFLEATRPTWWRLFRAAAFARDGVHGEPPAAPVRLYRAAPEDRREGWSWTENPEFAKFFLRYFAGSVLWTCTVPPDRLLAAMTVNGETEIIADVAGLDVRRAGP